MNGIRIKVRENFDELELWMNSGVADKEKLEGLKNYLKENTQITEDKAFNVIPFSSKKWFTCQRFNLTYHSTNHPTKSALLSNFSLVLSITEK